MKLTEAQMADCRKAFTTFYGIHPPHSRTTPIDEAFLYAYTTGLAANQLSAWQPIETAPKDDTLVLLLLARDDAFDNGIESEADHLPRTIGHNNFEHDGIDKWQFSGWNWENDYYTEGLGTPTHWMPTPAPPINSPAPSATDPNNAAVILDHATCAQNVNPGDVGGNAGSIPASGSITESIPAGGAEPSKWRELMELCIRYRDASTTKERSDCVVLIDRFYHAHFQAQATPTLPPGCVLMLEAEMKRLVDHWNASGQAQATQEPVAYLITTENASYKERHQETWLSFDADFEGRARCLEIVSTQPLYTRPAPLADLAAALWKQLDEIIDDLRGGAANRRPYSPRPENAISALLKIQSKLLAAAPTPPAAPTGELVGQLVEALERTLSWLTSYPNEAALGKTGPYEQARAALAAAQRAKEGE